MKETPRRRRITVTSFLNELFTDKLGNRVFVSVGGRGVAVSPFLRLPYPFRQQASEQIFTDDVNSLFLHLEYLLHETSGCSEGLGGRGGGRVMV
jgi:hypothetical protein